MAGFGFDPTIGLLGTQTQGPGPNETLQLLSQLRTQQLQQQQLEYNQRRQQTLAGLVSQNAGTYTDPMAHALAQGGYGAEAQDAQDFGQKMFQAQGAILRNQASSIRSKEQGDKWLASLTAQGRAMHNLPEPGQWTPETNQAFVASGLPADKQGEFLDAERRRTALADANSTQSTLRAAAGKAFGLPIAPGTPGNAIDDKELDLAEKAQAAKQRSETARLMMGLGPSGAAPLDMNNVPNWIKTAAITYHTDGSLPSVKDPGGYTKKMIMRVAGEMFANDNIPANRATFKANEADLEEAQKQAGATDVNEAKARGDMEVFRKTVAPLFSTNSQWLNAHVRDLQNGQGNVDAARAMTARTALVNGINKVLSNGNVSDSSRKEASELIQEGASINQLNGVLDVLTQDMARSKAAMHERVSNAQARISGKPAPAAEGSTPAAAPALDHDAAAAWLKDPTNKTSPYYGRNLAAYKKAHGGAEP